MDVYIEFNYPTSPDVIIQADTISGGIRNLTAPTAALGDGAIRFLCRHIRQIDLRELANYSPDTIYIQRLTDLATALLLNEKRSVIVVTWLSLIALYLAQQCNQTPFVVRWLRHRHPSINNFTRDAQVVSRLLYYPVAANNAVTQRHIIPWRIVLRHRGYVWMTESDHLITVIQTAMRRQGEISEKQMTETIDQVYLRSEEASSSSSSSSSTSRRSAASLSANTLSTEQEPSSLLSSRRKRIRREYPPDTAVATDNAPDPPPSRKTLWRIDSIQDICRVDTTDDKEIIMCQVKWETGEMTWEPMKAVSTTKQFSDFMLAKFGDDIECKALESLNNRN